MHPYHQAIQDAHLWTPTCGSGEYSVRHPNGVELAITRSKNAWFLRAIGHRGRYLAKIPRVSRVPGLLACIEDTLHVLGPDVRARMEQLLLHVQLWALSQVPRPSSLCLLRGTGQVLLSSTSDSYIAHRLPEDLVQSFEQLQHVFLLSPPRRLHRIPGRFKGAVRIVMPLPTTAHGILELRTRLLED